MTKPHPTLQDTLTLGKETDYPRQYNPGLLQAVPRQIGRHELKLTEPLPFVGQDIWHAYELSWLNHKGKPVVALATFVVPFDSANLIESKSFKLYLNSLNQNRFRDLGQVYQLLKKDLSACAGSNVEVTLHNVNELQPFQPTWIQGSCLDDLDVEITDYQYQPELLQLKAHAEFKDERLFSHLLKSNCLITNQPDWASVFIHYRGPAICHESLLRYIVSFREHNEFHEQCVERIFSDIWRHCQPKFLAVYARYTRRGGLDINPLRSSEPYPVPLIRLTRQ
ncbi:NADPH-dependent 7-cyano-7-deazaguanine reductase QueF [Alkalimonas collagenimarina]|uniref:NADPH-dependent 7-cyano-7-deazaguanine reductase n=1 Tax=Alkalimonas collagenimarina TaxID=400390 RepID=A0ABT9GV19_9GAMM|nr:NADPH-dependent 7-cyano-7-deazaguanine reductase QueF [Alkalimonas collagenimarina]MDP4534907.1 NADPH-dependent 7-cyano-7-deazaguanine reductase QueF [Alkalimonas collagenimarina]